MTAGEFAIVAAKNRSSHEREDAVIPLVLLLIGATGTRRDDRPDLRNRPRSPSTRSPPNTSEARPRSTSSSPIVRPATQYPVLYVLPVYANPKPAAAAINQARAENLHNRFDLICVTPSFDTIPWYFDDPADPRIRQDAYMVHAVVPFVEKKYPAAAEPRGRLLVGFSKSGWGAFTLLLRHPDVFGRAASFDAPLMAGRGGSFRPPARYHGLARQLREVLAW